MTNSNYNKNNKQNQYLYEKFRRNKRSDSEILLNVSEIEKWKKKNIPSLMIRLFYQSHQTIVSKVSYSYAPAASDKQHTELRLRKQK